MGRALAKHKREQEREYIVPCRITRLTSVIVMAESEDEARAKFNDLDWVAEDARDIGEIVNFEVYGIITENV